MFDLKFFFILSIQNPKAMLVFLEADIFEYDHKMGKELLEWFGNR